MEVNNWDGLCPICGGHRFFNVIHNIYECRDCETRVEDNSSDYDTLSMLINGTYKAVQLFLQDDQIGNTDFCGVMDMDTYNELDEIAGREVCRDEIVDLDPLFYTKEDVEEWYNEEGE